MTEKCPLCGNIGRMLRRKSGLEILNLYSTYLGKNIPLDILKLKPDMLIQEFQCSKDYLVWYSPAPMGDGEYYRSLTCIYPWYYNPNSWDKKLCLEIIQDLKNDWIVEVGSGDGAFLLELRKIQPRIFGIEINPDSISLATKKGLEVYNPDQLPKKFSGNGVLCMLQSIEHLEAPVSVLQHYVQNLEPLFLALSAPCSQSLLALTSDPLSWPPHHATAWSEDAFRELGQKLGYSLKKVEYSPLSFDDYHIMMDREVNRKIPGFPRFEKNRIGRFVFNLAQKIGISKFKRGHSIFVLLKRDQI